jgi:hypothetical protein
VEKDPRIPRTPAEMISSFSEPANFLWAAGGLSEGLCSGDPRINSVLLCVPTGDSIFEATVADLDKQGETAFYHGDEASSPLHFHRVSATAETGAFTACIYPGPQPNLPTYRVSVTRCPMIQVQIIASQVQPSGVGEHVQDTEDGDIRNMKRKALTVCTDCNKGFGRAQELTRHRKDVHEQRRRCLFCGFKWTRPSNIKAHLFAKHSEKFTVKHLVAMQALRGRMIIAFLDAYNQGSGPV